MYYIIIIPSYQTKINIRLKRFFEWKFISSQCKSTFYNKVNLWYWWGYA